MQNVNTIQSINLSGAKWNFVIETETEYIVKIVQGKCNPLQHNPKF